MRKSTFQVIDLIGEKTNRANHGFAKISKQTHVRIKEIMKVTASGTVTYVRSVCRLVSSYHTQKKIVKTKHIQKTTRQLSVIRAGQL